ncbi:MAG: gliding motility lipoprotein GldD [Alteromonas sp.]|mgnify:CR=1 FL=1|nr:gliding motility lipoprotein GldD [Alteromonas sp.]MAY22637.1 gliding motility lipoprotein GldD [Flavobacteriaceae bacterium]|tara:strand:+ start:85946 stop:86503 length:558 start_codon:yes stop_codon:yes gene_type:complete
MNSLRAFGIFFLLLIFASCGEDTVVKPSAMLRLQYPLPQYKKVTTNCPYSFEKNLIAQVEQKNGCAINLNYPQMKATIYLTYQPVRENIEALLKDAQKLTYDHTAKANEIFEQPRVDSIHKVYGMYYMINGDAATQSQFYVTDSTNHFLKGALYFEVKPNFDSIYPAVKYLRDDIRTLMETISWE